MAVDPGDANFKSKLDSKSKKIARDEIHEIESDMITAVQTFRKWVLEQQGWLKSPTDCEFLLRFLRARKYSQIGARETLENYLSNITNVPEWFANVDPAETKIQELLRMGIYFSPKKLDKDGRRLIFGRLGVVDPDKLKKEYGSATVFRTMCLVANWVVRDENCQVNGIKVLIDWSGITLQHASIMFTEGNAKRFMNFYQNSLPKRLKGINMYNEPPFFDAFFTIVSSFMKAKTKSRVKLHGRNMANVYEVIDKAVLPDEYLPDDYTGPSAGPLNQILDEMISDMMDSDYRDYIKKLSSSKYGVEISKKPKDQEPVGSFRKLTVD